MNRNKQKGSKDFNINNIGLTSLQACMISADDFLQTCHITNKLMLSGHVSTIILMQDCDSKYRKICFNRALIITHTRKI